ncbi:hypothetical protein OIO90_006089 [Microbotryomycetes sp. JL221]|nr:hypothetical protein OIO90_006089 [Microbotryomycetes sp. JL221]
MPLFAPKQPSLPTYTPPVSGNSTPNRFTTHHSPLPPTSGAIAEKIALSYNNNNNHGTKQLGRRLANCFVPMRIQIGHSTVPPGSSSSTTRASIVTSKREIVIPVLAWLHPLRPLNSNSNYMSKRRDSHHVSSQNNLYSSTPIHFTTSPWRILIAIVGTIIILFFVGSTSVKLTKPIVKRLTHKTQMPWSEPSTLVFSDTEIERIWRWEIASGQYPSKRPIDIELSRGMGQDALTATATTTTTTTLENPGLPKLSEDEAKRERQVKQEVERRLRDQTRQGKRNEMSSSSSPAVEIIAVGPKRQYMDVPQSRKADASYPRRPRLGATIDMDAVMDHCDFATDKYVRDCLDVLRSNAGLSTTSLRRGIMDSWRITFETSPLSSSSSNVMSGRTRDILEAHRHDMTTLLHNSTSSTFASLLASRQQMTLSQTSSSSSSSSRHNLDVPRHFEPHSSHPTADPACDPDYPHLFHIFWAGPFTDKPYSAALSFLYTQNLQLSKPMNSNSKPPVDVCRPQLWIWINPGPASSLPDRHAVSKMMKDLSNNPWSAPLLHQRFKDSIKFKLWNTTEQLDGVSEMKGWREMALFNSGGVKYGGKDDLHAQDDIDNSSSETDNDESLDKRGTHQDAQVVNAEQAQRDAGVVTHDSAERALSSARQEQSDPSTANVTGVAAALPTKARDELFERVGSTSTKYDRLTVVLSDMARFVLTHRFGGVYLDADTLLLRDWTEMFNWHGSFAYRWSRLEKYNTAVLKLQRGSAIGNFLFRTAVSNGLDFHPMTISRYTKDARLEGLLLRLPDALFDPAWLNTEYYQRDRPPFPYFKRFEDFFETPKEIAAAPSSVGFQGFFQGAFSYHYHNGWWMPFDSNRNFPDLGSRFQKNERLARGRLLRTKLQDLPLSLRDQVIKQGGHVGGPSPTEPKERMGAATATTVSTKFTQGRDHDDDESMATWGEDESDFDTLDWSQETVEQDDRDLSWSAVLKRTFESYIRGDSPNMYGEWINWNDEDDDVDDDDKVASKGRVRMRFDESDEVQEMEKLLVARGDGAQQAFVCNACPYKYPIQGLYVEKHHLERKVPDDVLGGEDSWKNVDSTPADCKKCGSERAFFMQLQIRSADEPMTTFYRSVLLLVRSTWANRLTDDHEWLILN